MTETIDYSHLMQNAMRGLLKTVLRDIAKSGLPGDHHFFITFMTTDDGVDIPQWLVDKFPDQMTIVIQHWFEDLDVTDTQFEITLNFDDAPQRMTIPFSAITTFVDPSVEFGLQFETAEIEQIGDVADQSEESMMIEIDLDAQEDATPKEAEIVSLDQFRK